MKSGEPVWTWTGSSRLLFFPQSSDLPARPQQVWQEASWGPGPGVYVCSPGPGSLPSSGGCALSLWLRCARVASSQKFKSELGQMMHSLLPDQIQGARPGSQCQRMSCEDVWIKLKEKESVGIVPEHVHQLNSCLAHFCHIAQELCSSLQQCDVFTHLISIGSRVSFLTSPLSFSVPLGRERYWKMNLLS